MAQRNPMQVGMMYRVKGNEHNHHKDARLRDGDVLLCLEHTGDCHYTWVLFEETNGNAVMRYFHIEKVYQDYVVSADPMIVKPLNDTQMLKCMAAYHFQPGRAAMLINRPVKEKKKRLNTKCPVCNNVTNSTVTPHDLEWPIERSNQNESRH